jgi:hypothetical protein
MYVCVFSTFRVYVAALRPAEQRQRQERKNEWKIPVKLVACKRQFRLRLGVYYVAMFFEDRHWNLRTETCSDCKNNRRSFLCVTSIQRGQNRQGFRMLVLIFNIGEINIQKCLLYQFSPKSN